MARDDRKIARAVLAHFGRTWCQELGIGIEKGSPGALFKLAVFAQLSAKPINHKAAASAAKALFGQGWTSAAKMSQSTWQERTRTLNQAGYARYDESTSRMLGENCRLLMDRYGGDLRKLRRQANEDPREIRTLLEELKGVGDTAANIFFREVQPAWPEIFPFADKLALRASSTLGLPDSAGGLRKLVPRKDFARLVAGLVRVYLEKGYDEVKRAE